MCYLPTTLVVLALMIRLHDRTDRQLRIQAGLAGYIAALVAVPVVSAMLNFRPDASNGCQLPWWQMPVVGAMPDSSQIRAMTALREAVIQHLPTAEWLCLGWVQCSTMDSAAHLQLLQPSILSCTFLSGTCQMPAMAAYMRLEFNPWWLPSLKTGANTVLCAASC